MKLALALCLALLFLSIGAYSQDYSQTIRGTVVDKQSQSPLPGASVVLLNSTSPIGVQTDIDGNFKLEKVPLGRQGIQVTFLGYNPATLANLTLTSGKEIVLTIELEEKVITTDEVVISAEKNKAEALNEMTTVSARAFTVEETSRYAGSFNDPSRMAMNYAGVANTNDSRNDIIIRGNSPLGLLWRLEGINIPNPNHFGALGTTGGPVSILNNNDLANSDFLTGAFPSEYGNATSGVFDLNMRSGNNEKREYVCQFGFNGLELGAEGPFSKKSKASYLANYRYSTLQILDALHINLGIGAIPQYQDFTFKLNFPGTKFGKFSVFGIGGLSHITIIENQKDSSDMSFPSAGYDAYYKSGMGVVGITHTYFINESTYLKTAIANSIIQSNVRLDTTDLINNKSLTTYGQLSWEQKYSFTSTLNKKFSARNSIRIGITGDLYNVHYADSFRYSTSFFLNLTDFNVTCLLFQTYAQWQHKFTDLLVLNTGLHYQLFLLNNSQAIEPRAGLKWNFKENQSLSLGMGMHSQMQPFNIYGYETYYYNTKSYVMTNKNLDFSKSNQIILGYDYLPFNDFRIKIESYYQYLYEIPIEPHPSYFSVLNVGADYVLPYVDSLVNKGTGQNYGLELTVEKFFSKHYYFLLTNSFFQSTYQGSDGITRNTAFNGNYVANALSGMEFQIGKNKRNVIAIDLRITAAGGKHYVPINIVASQAAHRPVYYGDEAYIPQYQDYFRTDIKLTYRLNGKKISQEWVASIQNASNRKNIFQETYDVTTGAIKTEYQMGIFPMIQYRILF